MIVFLSILTLLIGLSYGVYDYVELNQTITLKQAYSIANIEAKKWDADAVVAAIASLGENKEGTMGEDGRRRKWNLIFVVPNKSKSLLLVIENKEVKFTKDFNTIEGESLNMNEVVLDSPEAVAFSKSKLNLQPGRLFPDGYHFVLQKADKNSPIQLMVAGYQNQKVYYDATKHIE